MRIQHGRASLELHELARGNGRALLLLHALFGSSAQWGEAPAAWPGSVYALDFCGHGRSQWLAGGGYYPELLVGDADAALARIGRAAVAGAGLGAYVALLLAGARPTVVPAALLLPGAGLAGGGALPDPEGLRASIELPGGEADSAGHHDPIARALDHDARPPGYVEPFARAAGAILLAEDSAGRPPWWEAIRRCPGVESVPVEPRRAFARLAEIACQERPLRPAPAGKARRAPT